MFYNVWLIFFILNSLSLCIFFSILIIFSLTFIQYLLLIICYIDLTIIINFKCLVITYVGVAFNILFICFLFGVWGIIVILITEVHKRFFIMLIISFDFYHTYIVNLALWLIVRIIVNVICWLIMIIVLIVDTTVFMILRCF